MRTLLAALLLGSLIGGCGRVLGLDDFTFGDADGGTDAATLDGGEDGGESDAGGAEDSGEEDATEPVDDVGTDASDVDAFVPFDPAFDRPTLGLGLAHTCAILGEGEVYCWGEQGQGRLGNGEETSALRDPVRARVDAPAVALDASGQITCALTNAREVWCWGIDPIGAGSTLLAGSRSPIPVHVPSLDGAETLAVGSTSEGAYVCVLYPDGAASCAGEPSFGRTGTSASDPHPALPIMPVAGARRIDALRTHTCASGDSAVCWGADDVGQLARGSAGSSPDPEVTVVLSGALSVGERFTCAIEEDERIRCVGENGGGQFGAGPAVPFEPSVTPVETAFAPGVGAVALSLGRFHGCALRRDQHVICWGAATDTGAMPFDGRHGQTGIGDRETPGTVEGLPDEPFDEVVAGWRHTCARQGDDIWCWGYNASRQLAGPSFSPTSSGAAVPVPPPV